jgi:DNA-binding NtrC family response regulator
LQIDRIIWRDSLSQEYFLAFSSSDRLEIMRLTRNRCPEIAIIAHSSIPTLDELAKNVRCRSEDIPLFLMVRNGSEDLAIAALRAGIQEYIKYPCNRDDLLNAVSRCLGKTTLRYPTQCKVPPASLMIGESEAMRDVRATLSKVACTDSTILITGETGTGKELAAEFVHQNSSRKFQPFITVNCAAIPDSLLESELFGYERGTFTGAQCSSDGKLKAAEGGTVFLDEVGDMSLFAQAKILRAIERKEIQRLGSSGAVTVDVRIIAASNQDLEKLAAQERFRKDLYFRLNVARVYLPPLRERKEDIPSIVGHCLQELNVRFGRQVLRLADPTWDYLLSYDWPGNIRELKNLLEAIFIHTSSSEISPAELPSHLRQQCERRQLLPNNERERLLSALLATDWNKSADSDDVNGPFRRDVNKVGA